MRSAVDTATLLLDYQRVDGNVRAELARHRLCYVPAPATAPRSIAHPIPHLCHLDADHKPPHRARVGDRIETPRGPRRQIIEWR